MRPIGWAARVVLLLAAGVGGASAQEQDPREAQEQDPREAQEQDPREAEARQAFAEGREHFDDGRFRLAVESFQRAYALLTEIHSPMAPALLYNMATALDELPDRQREARDAYRRYLEESPADQRPELRHTVELRIQELDLRIAEQADASETSADASDTSVDAEQRPQLERTDVAKPGPSMVGPIVAAAGGALLVTGAILGGLALGQGNDFEAACPELTACSPELRSDYDRMRTRSIAADALLFGGLTIAAVGTVLIFTLKKGDGDTAVVAACGGQGCFASARGRF